MAKMNWGKIPKDYAPAYERKKSKPKRPNKKATPAQKDYMTKLGITFSKECTKKEAYSMISLKVLANEKLKKNLSDT